MTAEIITLSRDIVGAGHVLNPDKVLEGAKGETETVCVIGYRPDGSVYGASSVGAHETLWLFEQARSWILAGCPEDGVNRG